MISHARLGASAVVACIVVGGCGTTSTGLADPVISTDQVSYTLTRLGDWFTADLEVTVLNAGTRTLYLHPLCGTSSRPAYRLERPDGSNASVGRLGCPHNIPDPVAPIAVPPGGSYQDRVHILSGRAQPQAWTGAFRLQYYIRSTGDAVVAPTDLLPMDSRVSNEFTFVLPSGS